MNYQTPDGQIPQNDHIEITNVEEGETVHQVSEQINQPMVHELNTKT